MLNWNRIEKLNIPLPATVREMLTPNTVVNIVAAESLFGTIPACSTYEWNGGLSSQSSGCVFAAAIGRRGHWNTLEVAQEWSNARGEQYESTVLPIGEQVEKLGITRPAMIILLEEDYDSDDADEEKKLIIGIGGRSVRRYLEWRINTAAAELTNALREAVPEPPKEPRRRSRAHLLAD